MKTRVVVKFNNGQATDFEVPHGMTLSINLESMNVGCEHFPLDAIKELSIKVMPDEVREEKVMFVENSQGPLSPMFLRTDAERAEFKYEHPKQRRFTGVR